MQIPELFSSNRGLASVSSKDSLVKNSQNNIEISCQSLDNIFGDSKNIGVMKLDVEGHELEVLKGADNLFSNKKIRDCVFEEHRSYPTPVTDYFENKDYTLFRIQRGFFKPSLLAPDSKIPRTSWEPTSFIATCNPERAIKLFGKSGWQVFQSRTK